MVRMVGMVVMQVMVQYTFGLGSAGSGDLEEALEWRLRHTSRLQDYLGTYLGR